MEACARGKNAVGAVAVASQNAVGLVGAAGFNGIGLVAFSVLNAMGLVTIGVVNSVGLVAVGGVNAIGFVAIGGVNAVGVVAIGGLNATGVCCRRREERQKRYPHVLTRRESTAACYAVLCESGGFRVASLPLTALKGAGTIVSVKIGGLLGCWLEYW